MCISSPKMDGAMCQKEKNMLIIDYIAAGTQRCQTGLGIRTDSSYGSGSGIFKSYDQGFETQNAVFDKNNP
jgi:hypothetical protein